MHTSLQKNIPGLESLKDKKGVVSYEGLLKINGTEYSAFQGGARATGGLKSEDFINEVLDDAVSVMNLTEEETQGHGTTPLSVKGDIEDVPSELDSKGLRLHFLDETSLAAVAEWYRHRIVAGFVTSSSPVPLKTRRVGQRCTLNLSRAETSSRWCGVEVRRGGAGSGVVHVT
ncbi:uncharacterized protein TNCV_5057811 [Trichonephila clavipes]|nr:uncharacterized protein TNCV_5057811 [Trichonephila clavipes]